MTQYTVMKVSGEEEIPIRPLYLRTTRYMDLRPDFFQILLPYKDIFEPFDRMRIYRNDELYINGIILSPRHYYSSHNNPPIIKVGAHTLIMGLDYTKDALNSRRFEVTNDSEVTYAADPETTVFSNIIDACGLKEGQVDSTTVDVTHVYKGESCRNALELLMYIVDREVKINQADNTIDFQAGVGKHQSVSFGLGEQIDYAEVIKGEGARVINDIEVGYNQGGNKVNASDSDSIAQFKQRDYTTDLYSVSDQTATEAYRDLLLADYKMPLRYSMIVLRDNTHGMAYEPADWITINCSKINLSGILRVIQIDRSWDEKGEVTSLYLAEKASVSDTRRFRKDDVTDLLFEVYGNIHEVSAY